MPVSLRNRLDEELKAAMRSSDAMRRDSLRMVLAAVQKAEKEGKHVLADDEMIGILTRELKVRRESVDTFRAGGREDLVAKKRRPSRSYPSSCPNNSPTRNSALWSSRP